jgi:hypothetical protein
MWGRSAEVDSEFFHGVGKCLDRCQEQGRKWQAELNPKLISQNIHIYLGWHDFALHILTLQACRC